MQTQQWFGLSESEATLLPITGHFSIETLGMREPLYTLWQAEGQILPRQAHSTSIAFDARGARAGETHTYLVAVQVVESGARGRAVQSGGVCPGGCDMRDNLGRKSNPSRLLSGVIFEEYDTPEVKTVNSVATIGQSKGAWFKDSEGNLLALEQFD